MERHNLACGRHPHSIAQRMDARRLGFTFPHAFFNYPHLIFHTTCNMKLRSLIALICFCATIVHSQTPPSTPSPSPTPTPTPLPLVRVGIEYPADGALIEKNTVEVFMRTAQPLPAGYAFRVILNNDSPIHNDDYRKPVVLKNLKPGGQFLRIYVVDANGLMVKDAEAFASIFFFVDRKDFRNTVSPGSPLLTVNLPSGGLSMPDDKNQIALDFLVHHAPMDGKSGYKIKCQLNQQTFYYDTDQTVYWNNLAPGKHKVTIDLLDPADQPVLGQLNHVVREFEIAQILKPLPSATPPPSGQQMFHP